MSLRKGLNGLRTALEAQAQFGRSLMAHGKLIHRNTGSIITSSGLPQAPKNPGSFHLRASAPIFRVILLPDMFFSKQGASFTKTFDRQDDDGDDVTDDSWDGDDLDSNSPLSGVSGTNLRSTTEAQRTFSRFWNPFRGWRPFWLKQTLGQFPTGSPSLTLRRWEPDFTVGNLLPLMLGTLSD